MRIGLLVGSTLHPLAGAAGVSERVHSSAGDFILAPVADKQIVRKVRAAAATAIDRGNLLHSVSFSTTRIFDSAAEAWLWALDYDATFPREGILQMDAVTAGGAIMRRRLSNAVVAPPRRRVIGRSVLLDYQVDGSVITTGPVAATAAITYPIGAAAGADAVITIGGEDMFFGPMSTAADQSAANTRALTLQTVIDFQFSDILTTTVAENVITLTLIASGSAGNSVTLAKSGTNGVVLSGATFTGGLD